MGTRMLHPRAKGPIAQNNAHRGTRLGPNFLREPGNLQDIRGDTDMAKIAKDRPEIEAWLIREYIYRTRYRN